MSRQIKLLIFSLMVVSLLAGSFFSGGSHTAAQEGSVVILVVDDFTYTKGDTTYLNEVLNRLANAGVDTGFDPPIDPNDWYWDEDDELCFLNLDHAGEQGVAEAGGMGGGEGSHGNRVATLLRELTAQNVYGIEVAEVHVEDYQVSVIAQNIEAAMAEYPASYYVINMSFGLVPCRLYGVLAPYIQEILAAQGNGDWDQFRIAVNELTGFYRETVEEFLVLAREWYCSGSEVRDCGLIEILTRQAGQSEATIAVASAGNFGFINPIWPAAWPGVVSVSAGDEEDGFLTPTGSLSIRIPSNSGEFVMPGFWSYISSISGNTELTMGTSYAAPRLSFVMAVALALDPSTLCFDNNTGYPGFAYAGWSGYWRDLGLAEAPVICSPSVFVLEEPGISP